MNKTSLSPSSSLKIYSSQLSEGSSSAGPLPKRIKWDPDPDFSLSNYEFTVQSNVDDSSVIEASHSVALNTIGKRKELDDLIDEACAKPFQMIAFVEVLDSHGFDILDIEVFTQIFDRITAKGLEPVIEEFVSYSASWRLFTERFALVIMKWLTSIDEEKAIRLLTQEDLEEINYSGQDLYLPLFFRFNAIDLIKIYIDHLVDNRKYDLISRLLFCVDKQGNKYIESPATAIESVRLLRHLSGKRTLFPEIDQIFETRLHPKSHEPTSLDGYFRSLDRIFEFHMDLEAQIFEFNPLFDDWADDAAKKVSDMILKHLSICLHPAGSYVIASFLAKMIRVNQEPCLSFALKILETEVYRGTGETLLHHPAPFSMLGAALQGLIENDRWDLLSRLLTNRSSKGCIPFHFQNVMNEAIPFCVQLVNKGQFRLLSELLTIPDHSGETPLHYCGQNLASLLDHYVKNDQFDLLEKMLCSQNSYGNTPLHRVPNLFGCYGSLFSDLIDKGQFELLSKVLSVSNKANIAVIYGIPFESLHTICPFMLRLMDHGRVDMVEKYLTTERSNRPALIHCRDVCRQLKPVLESLIERNEFEAIERILSNKDPNNFTPVTYSANSEVLRPLLLKLCEKGRRDIATRLWLRAEWFETGCKTEVKYNRK